MSVVGSRRLVVVERVRRVSRLDVVVVRRERVVALLGRREMGSSTSGRVKSVDS